MSVNCRREGQNYVLEIDALTFQDWNLDPDKQLKIVKIGNGVLLLPPVESEEDDSDAAFEHAVAETLSEYDETFKELS